MRKIFNPSEKRMIATGWIGACAGNIASVSSRRTAQTAVAGKRKKVANCVATAAAGRSSDPSLGSIISARLVTRWEYHEANFLDMLQLGCLVILLRYSRSAEPKLQCRRKSSPKRRSISGVEKGFDFLG